MKLRQFIATLALALLIISSSVMIIRPLWNTTQAISSGILLLISRNNFTPEEIIQLARYGLVTTVSGPVAVIHTQMDAVPGLMQLPFISQIESSHPLRIQLDRSIPDIGADLVWHDIKDDMGRNVTGAGVVIGFVDTGIDLSHRDFKFPNGTTKILYVWDQTMSGNAPSGFNYGNECTSIEITAGLCTEFDSFGHGTHVAGIAASTGLATGNYTGIAPGASIIFVKSGQQLCNGSSWNFDNAQILDGVNYIIAKSKQLGMRAVISLSLGGNIGGHDGTDPLEQGLDAFVKNGTPIVVAAGNEAESDEHIIGRLTQGSDITFQVEAATTTTDLQIGVWYSLKDSVDATLKTPDGRTYETPSGGDISRYAAAVGNITTMSSSSKLSNEAYFEINSTTSLPESGWYVTLNPKYVNSTGEWDAWVDAQSCSYPPATFIPGLGYKIDANDTIDIPGTAQDVITVGAYASKSTWEGMDHQIYGSSDIEVGQIASFSSLGPTRDGRIKPDIVAPGLYIASARSSMIPVSDSDPDIDHRVLAGTSMATPHVAGVIALMLQYSPTLQPSEITQILKNGARLDSFTGLLPSGSPIWGFGKLDARTATGFYRFTLITQNLPPSATITIRVDNSPRASISGGSWYDLYFLKNTTHTVEFESNNPSSSDVRYMILNSPLQISSNQFLTLAYKAQYFVEVVNVFSSQERTDWYDANTTLETTPPTMIRTSGLLANLGSEYVLFGLISIDGRIVPTNLTVSQPETLTEGYVLTYPWITFAGVLIASIILLITVLKKLRLSASPA
ncbi:MAG TPA: S8 family serine peptidase [Candidatus Bathyarchaeia archaeon]|nr:S8 family serine peptidase [Candidatus Bathyarchaeia archaeon]HKM78178.1 S8 family serine peptidase [Candidatus Bathyarchaeia archaeon]